MSQSHLVIGAASTLILKEYILHTATLSSVRAKVEMKLPYAPVVIRPLISLSFQAEGNLISVAISFLR